MLKDFDEISVDLNIPMWIPHLVLPIAFALAAYRCAEKLVDIYKTDSNDIKLFSEHEAVIKEITSHKGEK
jgi:C4-dicarboxylate transporter DctQ subunit